MGQKVHPTGIRLGIVKDWGGKWYAEGKKFAKTLHDDLKARKWIDNRLKAAGVSATKIERLAGTVKISVSVARPGIVIGKKGADIDSIRFDLTKLLGAPVHLNIEEVRKPELDARLVAESIAQQLEKRIMFRRAMKRAVSNALKLGALGVKVCVAGRLGGAEIARTEWYREGRVPLHTFRADIDYNTAEAHTTYGVIGVKVWIFKGEIFGNQLAQQAVPVEAK